MPVERHRNGGDAPRDPLRWVRGTSLTLAMDELARRSRHQGLDAEALQAPAPEATDPTPSRDILRTEALKKARALLVDGPRAALAEVEALERDGRLTGYHTSRRRRPTCCAGSAAGPRRSPPTGRRGRSRPTPQSSGSSTSASASDVRDVGA